MARHSGLLLSGVPPILSPIGRELAAEQSGWYRSESFLRAPCAVVDQGRVLPCCVSCGISTCVEILDPSCGQLSPLFHFHMFHSTFSEGPPDYSMGMTLLDGLKVLAMRGICLQRYHPVPYTKGGAMSPPDVRARSDALIRGKPFAPDNIYERFGFAPLNDDNRIGEWKRVLLGMRPIIIGFYRTDRYWSTRTRLEGFPDRADPHAAVVLGYRESERSFFVQDSNGEGFATGGRWWLPYDRVQDDGNVVEEAYVVGRLPTR